MAHPNDGRLHIGERTGADHQRSGEPLALDPAGLTTHGVIVGMTGSGKTGLAVGLIEEALLGGVPVLAIDPKGDLGNLALTFPDLAPESFAPWTEGSDPAAVATTWREGLAGWGLDGTDVQALRDAGPVTIYTPGSGAGVGLNVVASLRRPADGADPEAVLDEVEGYVSGLLGLVGVEGDPLSSREHILLANIVQHSWSAGHDLDLAGLVSQVQEPPLRKLGVFELDEFFPRADRTALAMRLNGLLASPAFSAWATGEPLDIDALLMPGGRPACAVVTIAHLSDEERQMVVARVLGALVTWMRRQPGTDRLRALAYFDEVAGYVPPTAVPPAKAPILTLLKQARAFGLGLVLATQNPVDVDYKALSNAGTWMIGRLQTEQDKARLLDGLSAATGGVDVAAVGDTIASLAKREFVLRRPGSDAPVTFTSRWAMSYLRGPLTREQIATLMAGRAGPAPSVPTAGEGAASGDANGASSVHAPDAALPAEESSTSAAPAAVPPDLAPDVTPVMPKVADGTRVGWLDPAAPWAAEIGVDPLARTMSAAAVASIEVLYDDDRADLRQTEVVECVLHPLVEPLDLDGLRMVDHDPRDVRADAPADVAYRLPDAPIGTKAYLTSLQKALVDHLVARRTTTIQTNPLLKLYSRPGEVPEAFAARCDAVADAAADAAAAKVAATYAKRLARARDALATAEDRLDQAQEAEESRRNDEVLSGVGDVLGSLFGSRGGVGGVARKVGSAARRRGRSSEAATRVETASNRVDERSRAIDDLQAELDDALAAIADEWDAKAAAIEPYEVGLERTDVRVSDLAVVWVGVP
jgi:hypothetical protein